MDRYLTLKYADEYSEELELLSETILELIDIFYRALDADKTGEEVCLYHHFFAWMSIVILYFSLFCSLIAAHEVIT